MFTTGSKLLIGAAVLATLFAVVYGVLVEGALGTIGISFAAAALGLIAGINVVARDSNVSAMDTGAVSNAPAARPAPNASLWPLAMAVGGVLVVVGLVTYPVALVFGLAVLLAAAAEWMVQAWSERASAEAAYNAEVRGRLAHPLEFPVLAGVGIGIIVYSFSRIMLFLSKTGGVAAFAVIALLLLAVGFIMAYRPTLHAGAIGVVAAVATAGLVAGGIAAAIEGERDLHPHETTGDLAGEGECDTEEEKEADENASQSIAAKANLAGRVTLREDGTLVATAPGEEDEQDVLVIPRANPSNIRFDNETGEERRLVLDLGTRPELDEAGDVVEGSEVPDQRCTALVGEGGSQLLTVNVGQPSISSETPYRFIVPGVEGAEVEVVVP